MGSSPIIWQKKTEIEESPSKSKVKVAPEKNLYKNKPKKFIKDNNYKNFNYAKGKEITQDIILKVKMEVLKF